MAIKWHEYRVEIRIRDRLVGGIPVVPEGAERADAYERWARGQGVEGDPTFEATLPEALAADPDMPVAVEDIAGPETGFRSDDGGLYLEARQVKAMLREAAERLGFIAKVRGTRQVLQHDLVIRSPYGNQKLHLDRVEPDGKDERPISVVTRQGPRTAIKRFAYVSGVTIGFSIKILADGTGEGKLDTERIKDMLEFGGESLGLGADRSQGEGTFDVVTFAVIS